MSGTLRSWMHYIDLRSANGTQKEHMDIAIECEKIFKNQFPLIYNAIQASKKIENVLSNFNMEEVLDYYNIEKISEYLNKRKNVADTPQTKKQTLVKKLMSLFK